MQAGIENKEIDKEGESAYASRNETNRNHRNFLLKWTGTSRQRVDGAVSKKLATATVTGRDTARALESCTWRFEGAAEADVEITLV